MVRYYDYISTPKGDFIVTFNATGLNRILLPGQAAAKEDQRKKLPFPRLAKDLNCYLAGEVVDWSKYLLDKRGYSSFTAALLEAVSLIPYGRVLTYREVAEKAGFPGAWRAAGQALAANRHPILVPCHRVIKADGSLGGYSGATSWKKELLLLEGALPIT